MPDEIAETLDDTLARCHIELPDEQRQALERYARLLWSWNEQLNLTRHTDFDRFVSRDVVDTLNLAERLSDGRRVLDIGSGGGVPGVILSIIRPDLKMTFCESTAKKHRALAAMAEELALPANVFHARAEEILQGRRFDSLVARAVAPLPKLLYWLAPHWNAFDELLIIKGPAWVKERQESNERKLLARLELRCVSKYKTPGSGAENVILRVSRQEDEIE